MAASVEVAAGAVLSYAYVSWRYTIDSDCAASVG